MLRSLRASWLHEIHTLEVRLQMLHFASASCTLCLGCYHHNIFSLESKESTGSRCAPEIIDYRYEKFTAVTSSPQLLRCTSCVTGSGRRGSKPSLPSPSSPLLSSPRLLSSSPLLLSSLLDGKGMAESQTSRFCHSRQLTPATASRWRRA